MKSAFTQCIFAALAAACAFGQAPAPAPASGPNFALTEDTIKVSDHVWTIRGNPNIGIVIGSRATLVVDTGLGPRNGELVARVAKRLAPGNTKLFLTTTHFHPEHASGEPGFPAGTILIRNTVQQQDMEKHGQEMMDTFSTRFGQAKDLLKGVVLRKPDVLFDKEASIDLGAVTAHLYYFGGAHTKGDELIFVEPDSTLVSGDVVQNKTAPNIVADGGPSTSWIAVLDEIAALKPAHVLPDHSAPGDGTLVAQEKELLIALRTRALALKRQGVSSDDAVKQINAELKTQHPDWTNTTATGFVTSVYQEP